MVRTEISLFLKNEPGELGKLATLGLANHTVYQSACMYLTHEYYHSYLPRHYCRS